MKTKTANGKRAMPQTCCYSPDGKMIAAGCDDGSIQAWKDGRFVCFISLKKCIPCLGPTILYCKKCSQRAAYISLLLSGFEENALQSIG